MSASAAGGVSRLARRRQEAAIVVALAEPHGALLTSDLEDLRALATHADDVHIYRA